MLVAAAFLAAPTISLGAPTKAELDPEICAPSETFDLTVENAYFPFRVGAQWLYQGKEAGDTIMLRITVLDEIERMYRGRNSIDTRIIEERERIDLNEDGADQPSKLVEVSRNFFAPRDDGTVCYVGEEVEIYEDGSVVSDEGSWRADEGQNAPGIFMPASPEDGMTFHQERAPGVAEDQATIVRTGRAVTVPVDTFTNTIQVRDFNPLDNSRGTKVYAPGVGLIMDDSLELIRYAI